MSSRLWVVQTFRPMSFLELPFRFLGFRGQGKGRAQCRH